MKIIEFNRNEMQHELYNLINSIGSSAQETPQLEILLLFKKKVMQKKYNSLLLLLRKMASALVKGKICGGLTDTINGFLAIHDLKNTTVTQKLHNLRLRESIKPFLSVIPIGYDISLLVDMQSYPRELQLDLKSKLKSLWPGKNTLILAKQDTVAYPSSSKIAIRMPSIYDNILFVLLLYLVNQPLVAPSLNYPSEEVLCSQEEIERVFGNSLAFGLFDFSDTKNNNNSSNIYDVNPANLQLQQIR